MCAKCRLVPFTVGESLPCKERSTARTECWRFGRNSRVSVEAWSSEDAE